MPSLRKRVSSYFRQLSFHNDPREKRITNRNFNENTFITKYLQGSIQVKDGPEIVYGKNPTDLPNYEISAYEFGPNSIIGCYSGPNGGLTTVRRTEKHLSILDGDIDFIDTPDENADDATDNPSSSSDLPTKIDDSLLPNEWNRKSDKIYGISDSLYDRNQVTKNRNGDPIADCFGIITRKDSAILAVADGVNWGEKASIAAKSAVHGCLHYLNKTIFHDVKPFECITIKTDDSTTSNISIRISDHLVTNTRDVFVSLLRAFNCAHDLILENNGMLTTLTVAVVLPLKKGSDQYVCCTCNVGDTLAYVYSPKDGVREITKGSHDIYGNRDMRDALGALGPVDGIKPELSNLTLSLTVLQKGDIVLVASDGLTDNFDPNVCKFTVNSNVSDVKKKPEPVQVKNNPPTVRNYPQPVKKLEKPPVKPPRKSKLNLDSSIRTQSLDSRKSSTESKTRVEYPECENPLVAHFVRENSVDTTSSTSSRRSSAERKVSDSTKPFVVENRASSLRRQAATSQKTDRSSTTTSSSRRPNSANFLLRSKTTLDMRGNNAKRILRNEDGIPYVTPLQRYELQLLLMEDVLKNGISGNESPCTTAKKLCENLVHFTISITSAKRHTLEDPELYYENRNGVLVEVSQQEKKLRRKRGLEKVQNLPGKLDHVTVVACNIGG